LAEKAVELLVPVVFCTYSRNSPRAATTPFPPCGCLCPCSAKARQVKRGIDCSLKFDADLTGGGLGQLRIKGFFRADDSQKRNLALWALRRRGRHRSQLRKCGPELLPGHRVTKGPGIRQGLRRKRGDTAEGLLQSRQHSETVRPPPRAESLHPGLL